MSNKCRLLIMTQATSLFIAVGAVATASPGFAQANCDGVWRVGIILAATHSSNCDPDRSHEVIVERGGIRARTPRVGINFRGTVDDACKAVKFWINRNGETAEGQGEITGTSARGDWKVTYPATNDCHGAWEAGKHGR
jgi:hypothetical protein